MLILEGARKDDEDAVVAPVSEEENEVLLLDAKGIGPYNCFFVSFILNFCEIAGSGNDLAVMIDDISVAEVAIPPRIKGTLFCTFMLLKWYVLGKELGYIVIIH